MTSTDRRLQQKRHGQIEQPIFWKTNRYESRIRMHYTQPVRQAEPLRWSPRNTWVTHTGAWLDAINQVNQRSSTQEGAPTLRLSCIDKNAGRPDTQRVLRPVHTGNNVEATFDTVERIVQLVAFDHVAWTLLLVWTGLYGRYLRVGVDNSWARRSIACRPTWTALVITSSQFALTSRSTGEGAVRYRRDSCQSYTSADHVTSTTLLYTHYDWVIVQLKAVLNRRGTYGSARNDWA